MIGAEEIQRAERILQVVYRERDMPQQLRGAEVDIDAFGQLLSARTELVKRHYLQAWNAADPRLHIAYNTVLLHMFLVGLVCGRGENQVIV